MSEENQFIEELKDSKETNDPFGEEVSQEKEPEPEEVEDSVKNRRHRRLEEKLQAEREANIRLAALLEAKNEAAKDSSETAYLKDVERIYGTDTPEAREATEILKKALLSIKEETREEALARFREEQEKSQAEVEKEVENVQSMLEDIEDTYGVEMTPKHEAGFKALMLKLSPKDREGNVIEYADHHAVWEEYQTRLQRTPDTRAKELSARSMTQSATTTTPQGDATWETLRKEMGW